MWEMDKVEMRVEAQKRLLQQFMSKRRALILSKLHFLIQYSFKKKKKKNRTWLCNSRVAMAPVVSFII